MFYLPVISLKIKQNYNYYLIKSMFFIQNYNFYSK